MGRLRIQFPRGAAAVLLAAALPAACGDAPSAPAAPDPVARAVVPAAPRDPAIDLFERRVAEVPGDAASRAILAHLYLRSAELHGDPGDLDRAEAAAREATRLEPAHAQATSHMARALAALHRFDEAIDLCDIWLDDRGPNVFVLEAKAEAALDAGRVVLAREVADVLLARSADAPAILLQARLAEVGGDPVRGAALARDAARAAADGGLLPHEIARCRVEAGGMALRAGRFADARADFDEALLDVKDHAGALGGLADLALLEGRAADAATLARRAADVRPAPAERFRAAAAFRAAGDEAAARSAESAAVAGCESRPVLLGRDLADHLASAGRHLDRALRLADEDVSRRPGPESHAVRARVLLALGKTDAAGREAAAARRFGTRTPSVLATAARVAARRGDREAAAALVADLAKLSPEFVPPDLEFPENPR